MDHTRKKRIPLKVSLARPDNGDRMKNIIKVGIVLLAIYGIVHLLLAATSFSFSLVK
jgi:capsule polysaccharide export protein KpsE/RkpR